MLQNILLIVTFDEDFSSDLRITPFRTARLRPRNDIYKGYYMVARRYEFYVLVARTISHLFTSLTREILFLPIERKIIHIFEPMCNVLFIIWRNQFNESKRRESLRH